MIISYNTASFLYCLGRFVCFWLNLTLLIVCLHFCQFYFFHFPPPCTLISRASNTFRLFLFNVRVSLPYNVIYFLFFLYFYASCVNFFLFFTNNFIFSRTYFLLFLFYSSFIFLIPATASYTPSIFKLFHSFYPIFFKRYILFFFWFTAYTCFGFFYIYVQFEW